MRHVDTIDGLVEGLDRLRRQAARGTRSPRVSLDALARRVDIPRSTLHGYLTGKYLPPPDVLDAILIALDCDKAEFRSWAGAWERVSARIDALQRAARSGLAESQMYRTVGPAT
jgi:transcriptional regulator with XRE-family HTH domain